MGWVLPVLLIGGAVVAMVGILAVMSDSSVITKIGVLLLVLGFAVLTAGGMVAISGGESARHRCNQRGGIYLLYDRVCVKPGSILK